MDVLTHYEVRKSKKQKTAFLTAVTAYATSQRYSSKIEKGQFGCRNLVIGDAEHAEYLITAHYDTCAWMPIPNFVTPFNLPVYILYQIVLLAVMLAGAIVPGMLARLLGASEEVALSVAGIFYWIWIFALMFGPANRHCANDNTSGVVTLLEIMASMPDNLRGKVAFVLFDMEEAGLIGSASYRKSHKSATDRQIVLNMDCVGDGDEIVLIPNKRLRRDDCAMAKFQPLCGSFGCKSLHVHRKGFVFYPSDQANFPLGVAIAALRCNRWIGRYYGRIHTHRDTVLDRTNVNVLRAALISLIASVTIKDI